MLQEKEKHELKYIFDRHSGIFFEHNICYTQGITYKKNVNQIQRTLFTLAIMTSLQTYLNYSTTKYNIIPIYHIMIWQSRSDYKEKRVS